MARGTLTVQQVSLNGMAPAFSAATATDGDAFQNDGNVLLEVKNTSAGVVTITIPTPAKVGGLDVADVSVTVPATTGDRIIGPFDPTIFNQADGSVYVNNSAASGVTLMAFRAR